MAVNAIVKERRPRQAETAAILRIPRPKVSALVNDRLDHLSREKPRTFLNALDRDVEMVIRASRAESSRASVRTLESTRPALTRAAHSIPGWKSTRPNDTILDRWMR
jgi:hypothetical protein